MKPPPYPTTYRSVIESSPPASATVTSTDSAGADIVDISDLGALDLPELNLTLLHSTAAEVELYHVVGAVFLPDSSLAIADRGSSEVVFLDGQGRERQRAGREGEGPGEYVSMARVALDAGGALSVFDDRLQRFTFLDTEGNVTGVQRLHVNEAYVPLVPGPTSIWKSTRKTCVRPIARGWSRQGCATSIRPSAR